MKIFNNTLNYQLVLAYFAVLITLGTISCTRESRDICGKSTYEVASHEPMQMSAYPAKHAGDMTVCPKGAGPGAIDGQALFVKNCSACHQVTGLGIPGVFPPLAKSPYVEKDEDRMAAIMIYGLSGPINVLGTTYTSVMAGLGATMTDEELAAVATYVRSSFGNNAPPILPETFTKARAKHGFRSLFSIQELGEEK